MYFFDFHHHTKDKGGIYNLNLLEKPSENFYSIGLHPKDISSWNTDTKKWLEENSLSPRCLAIGECGLDALIEIPLSEQDYYFSEQIKWANLVNKPIIIHCVRQFHRLPFFKKIAKTPMIVHGFHKKATIAEDLIGHGFHLSFGNALLHDVSLQNVFRTIPNDRFFLETDAAEIDIQSVYEKAAEVKNLTISDLEQIINNNLQQLIHHHGQ